MSCDMNRIKKKREELLAAGYGKEEVDTYIKLLTEKLSVKSSVVKEVLKKSVEGKSALSEDERLELRAMHTKITKQLEDDGADLSRYSKSYEKLLASVLTTEELARMDTLMKKVRVASGSDLHNMSDYLSQIRGAIKIQRSLGNEAFAQELEDDLAREEIRVAKYIEAKEAKESERDVLKTRIRNFRSMAELVSAIATESVTDVEKRVGAEIAKAKHLVNQREQSVKSLETSLKKLRDDKAKATTKAERDEASKAIDRAKIELKAAKKEVPKAKAELAALVQKYVDDGTIDKKGRLKFSAQSLESLIKNLTKGERATTEKLTKLSLKTFFKASKQVAKDLKSKAVNRSRSIQETEEGTKQRLELVDTYVNEQMAIAYEADTEFPGISLSFVVTLVGMDTVKHYVTQVRAKLTEPKDGSDLDTSPLTKAETLKLIKVWRRKMMDSIDNGLYSTDVGLINDENMRYLQAIASDVTVADLSDPNLFDMVIPPSMLPDQALALQTIGSIPVGNRANTAQQLVRWLEASRGSLLSLKSAIGFKGTIPESVLRMVLHQKLFDLAPTAFASALKPTRKRRVLSDTSAAEIIGIKTLLTQIGIPNPDKLPEFENPDWQNDFSTLAAFDIETDGVHVNEVRSMQIETLKDGKRVKFVWVNEVDDDGNSTLSDSLSKPVKKRAALTVAQINEVLQKLEDLQNQGYKVITHGGNHFDFGKLGPLGVDSNLLLRVSLRSIDTLRNLGYDNSKFGKTERKSPAGSKLKMLAENNLPVKEESAYGGKIIFRNGTVLKILVPEGKDEAGNIIPRQEEALKGGKDISTYWEEGLETGDWTIFDAYAQNDTMLTIDLAMHMSAGPTTDILLVQPDENGKEKSRQTITTKRPRSNLFLAASGTSNTPLTFSEIVEDLITNDKSFEAKAKELDFSTELEYSVDEVLAIFDEWIMKAWAIDPDNSNRMSFLKGGLKGKIDENNLENALLTNISQENRAVLGARLRDKFRQFGSRYISKLNGADGMLSLDAFTLDKTTNSMALNEEDMYIFSESELTYEEEIIANALEYLNSSEFTNRDRFFDNLAEDHGMRRPLPRESDEDYLKEVIPKLLRKYLPAFNRLSDFGNGTLDWKPAHDVGIAIVQIIMDQKESITPIDNILISGENVTNTLSLQGTQAAYKGRSKNFIAPDKSRVHFGSPFGLVNEEKAYDNFRLLSRVKFIMTADLDDAEVAKFLVTPQVGDTQQAISYFVGGTYSTVFPDVRSRTPFDNLRTLNERKLTAMEFMYNIPRLLSCYNHDCTYWGLNAGPRFLANNNKVFHKSDFISAGAPTASAVLAGAIDQIAWMSVFDFGDEVGQAEILRSLKSGIAKLRSVKDPKDLMAMTNKSDYKYSGLHISMAALTFYADGTFQSYTNLMKNLGLDAEFDDANIVDVGGLNDPRYAALDAMEADLELLKSNREAYKEKYRLSDLELERLTTVVNKLSANRVNAKEFLKGAITPRFYSAGFEGIFKGLMGKNADKRLGFSTEEIRVVTKVLLRELTSSHLRLIDQAIYQTDFDADKLRAIFMKSFKPVLIADNMKNTLDQNFFGEMEYVERRKAMDKYLADYINLLAEQIVPKMPERDKKVKEVVAALKKEYGAKVEEAAKLFNKKDMNTMTVAERADLMNGVNQVLAGSISITVDPTTGKVTKHRGSSNGYKKHLVLWALNNRAVTPFTLLDDNLELQRMVTGVHIDPADYEHFMEKTIFHTYGLEIASGRNHMFGNWGNGPESSKLAQIRVESGDEVNPYGIWDIRERETTPEYWQKAFHQQVLLDLAPHYYPPGYDPDTESRGAYWDANEARSIKELEAQAMARQIQLYAERKTDIKIEGLTPQELVEKMEDFAGTPQQRFRMRSLASDIATKNNLISLDSSVEGLASYRPMMADIDFSQRSIFALMEVQYAMRELAMRERQLFDKAQQMKEGNTDPNEVIPLQHRGHVSIYDKETLPFIPQQTSDTVSSIIMGPTTNVEQRAMRLQNQLTAFAKLFGWDDLLANGDWTRLHLLSQLRAKALMPALRLMDESGNTAFTTSVSARAMLFDGFFKTLGTRTKAFLHGKAYSVIDLMTNSTNVGFTQEDIKQLKTKHGDSISWFSALAHLGDRLDRLAPIKLGLVLTPVVVRGKPGLLKSKTRSLPINVFGLEVRQIYKLILASTAFRRAAKSYLEEHEPALLKTLPQDKNGYPLLEGLPLDAGLQEKILSRGFATFNDMAIELNSRFAMVLEGQKLTILNRVDKPALAETETIETGPMMTQAARDGFVIVNTAVDNPNTLWAFNDDMVVQLLNSLANNELFTNVELAHQTNKDIGGVETDLDILVREQERQMFEQMGEYAEETFEALTLLHKWETTLHSSKPLVIEDYTKADRNGKPSLIMDIPAYYTDSFKIEIDGNPLYITLEDSVFVTDIMQQIKLAERLGLNDENEPSNNLSGILKNFLISNLRKTQEKLDLDEGSPHNVVSQPVLKLAVTLYHMSKSIESGSIKQLEIVQFVQPGLSIAGSRKLLNEARKIVDVMQRVSNANPTENNEYYYTATAHFDRAVNVDRALLTSKPFVKNVVEASGKVFNDKEEAKAIKGILKAHDDFTRSPKMLNVSSPGSTIASDIIRFSDVDTFLDEFGATGENIVNQLQGMVRSGLISQKVMDMKLIMIGTLAIQNPGILVDLNLETRGDMGPTEFAIAAKANGKYTIGLNIHAMAVTPENEILLKFAEELVHIARIKYLNVNSADFKKMAGAFGTARAEPMIREMLMAMNLNKPYNQLEKDVKYAMKNTDEFLAHFGAMILLTETVYRADVITELESKYEAVHQAKVWWKRAFYNMKYIAKRALTKFAQMKTDPYYSDVYTSAYSVIQNLMFQSTPSGRLDVGNADMSFNAFATLQTTETPLTSVEKANVFKLGERGIAIDRALEDSTTPIADRARLSMEREEINTKLRDPKINPPSTMDMHEFEIQDNLGKVVRVDGRIRHTGSPNLVTRALFAEGLNNWSRKRGKRVDNKGTMAGLIRLIPDEADKVTSLFQNFLIQGYNQTNLSYNSPEALIVMISDMVDNLTVTTSSTYIPSNTQGGFIANKLALDGYMGNLRQNTSVVGRRFTNREARERINLNVIRKLHGLELTTTDTQEIIAVENITKAYFLWNERLREEMVHGRIKTVASAQHLDKVGLKLRDCRLLSKEERHKGFDAIRSLMQKKAIRSLEKNGEGSIVSPYVLFVSGLLPSTNSETGIEKNTELKKAYDKFLIDPHAEAKTAAEVMMKFLFMRAIKRFQNTSSVADMAIATSQFLVSGNVLERIQNETSEFIYMTREHSTSFTEAFAGISREDMVVLLKAYHEILSKNPVNTLGGQRFNELMKSDYGFHMGESQYSSEFKFDGSPIDALTYEFLGKMGATAYLFDERSPMLTSKDIFLNEEIEDQEDLAIAKLMFDGDIDAIGLSLLRGVGYDALQRVITERVFGIPGFNFTFQQVIDMARGLVQSRDPSTNQRSIQNMDGRGKQEERRSVLLLSLDRLEAGNKDARSTLGAKVSHNPSSDFILQGGRVAAQLAFGPNIPLATWLVEGCMGAFGGLIRGNNPTRFLVDAVDQNIGSFVLNAVGGLVRRKDGKVGLFNVDPPIVRNVGKNCLWLFEEIYSPMLPGTLTSEGFSSEVIERMSVADRFFAWHGRAQSNAMKAIRVASENQGNRRIAKDIQNGDLFKLRDAVNEILRDEKDPSNETLEKVLEKAGVRCNIELLLAYVRAGIFEMTPTTVAGGSVVKTGVLETIQYIMSTNKLDRGTVPLLAFFDLEYDIRKGSSKVSGSSLITLEAVKEARTVMMKAQKAYANMSMVLHHPLDGTASSTAHFAILSFYKSYPGLYTAQFLVRRGSVTPTMQFAFELMLYSIMDLQYNIILSLASGYYQWDKVMKALKRRELNYQEFIRLILKYPVFSNNLMGMAMQNIIPVLAGGLHKENLISSVGENAIALEIKQVIKALQGWTAFITGDTPQQHPIIPTFNTLGRIFPGIGSTLTKLFMMQAYGEINTSGRTPRRRSTTSYVLDKLHSLSDEAIREEAIRNIFKPDQYQPTGKKALTGEYESMKRNRDALKKVRDDIQKKSKSVPQVKEPKLTKERPEVTLNHLGTTPYEPPKDLLG